MITLARLCFDRKNERLVSVGHISGVYMQCSLESAVFEAEVENIVTGV